VFSITNFRSLWAFSIAISLYTTCILLATAIQAAEFIPLGSLNIDNFGSGASDVSYDGTVVVGVSVSNVFSPPDEDWGSEAFRWTAETGMVGLGDLPGGFLRSQAHAVSAEGSVVIGQGGIDGPNIEAFRWTEAGGMVGLGVIEGFTIESEANGISANGSVVVGLSRAQGPAHQEAYRWTADTGMVGLGDIPGGLLNSHAYDVSADGSVVVGWGEGASGTEAFRWTEAGGMVGLGNLPGGSDSGAEGVSADGSVVVGWSSSTAGHQAFRWTEAGGMEGLGNLPGSEGSIVREISVSADGRIVVGNDRTGGLTIIKANAVDNSKIALAVEDEFFVWTQSNGMQRLQDILEANGTTGLSGWSKLKAGGISANGKWVVGQGTNPSGSIEAFLAELPSDLVSGFEINAGLNDAWVTADAPFQGMFITVFPDLNLMFVAWFTFDSEQPSNDITAVFGAPDQRWITALGFYDGNHAELKAELTTGGVFNASDPLPTQDTEYGTIDIEFADCKLASVEFDFPSAGEEGSFNIQRVVDSNVALCETLNSG
jgi:probable HAF family extracellular repeat protein